MEGPRTIGRIWRSAAAARRSPTPYLAERETGWEPVSWGEADRRVDDLANGLLALGVGKGDAFAIFATTRVEWVLFDFALALVGAVTAPVYASSSARDCAHLLALTDAVGVLVEDDERRATIETIRDELPRLEHVITFSELESLAERGRAFAAENPDALTDAEAAVGEEDLFTYIFTSGTTGPPKACMIRHRNYYEMAAVIDRLDEFLVQGDRMLLYLPLAHNFGRLMHLLGPHAGYTIAFCSDPYRVAEALAGVRPTVFPSVPRVYEKIHSRVVARFDSATGLRRLLIRWALGVGRRVSELRQAQTDVPLLLAVQHRVADRLVYSKVKGRLGGRLRIGIAGGAPLGQEIARFLHALDVLVLEGYGLSECTTAASVNRPHRFKFGTVGPALPGCEVKLAEDGELLLRSGTVFAGYLKDEEATRAVLDDDGWLRTGDIAEIDDEGFIRITDRKKDILVTAGGKNVAPQNLENDLKSSKYVSQALVVGDRRPYVAALVTLDADEIGTWARRQGIEGDLVALAGDPAVSKLVQDIVDAANRDRSRYEQIKRFAILPRDFSAEEGEVTPTLKLRRRICEQHFFAEIEELYASSS